MEKDTNEWFGLDQALENPKNFNTMNGTVNTARKRGRPAKKVVSTESVPDTSPSATSAKDTEKSAITEENQKSIPSVSSTESGSTESTGLTLSLSGYVSSGYPTITDEQWASLKPDVVKRLKFLSKSKGVSLQECTNQICLFLEEARAVWLSERPLPEALEFYTQNYIMCIPKDLE